MDIMADAPLTPRGDGPPSAFRDVAWTPRDVLFGAFWFVGLFVGAQITIPPLAHAFGAPRRGACLPPTATSRG